MATEESPKQIKTPAQILELEAELTKLDGELEKYSHFSEEEVTNFLELIHEYNETRDIAHELVGRLARMDERPTDEIYQELLGEDYRDKDKG